MIISIDAEKALDTPFLIKLNKLDKLDNKIEGDYLDLINSIYKKPHS